MHEKTAIPDSILEHAAAMHSFDDFDPRRTAVIVVDMQHAFIAEDAVMGSAITRGTIANINRITGALREAGAAICYSRHTTTKDGPGALPAWQLREGSVRAMTFDNFTPGTAEQGVFSELEVAPEDLVFDKYRYSCFYNAAIDLHAWLQERDIDTVVIVGTVTSACCESTARDAIMRDYQVYFVADATSAVTQQEHDAALIGIARVIGRVVETDELLALVPASQTA